jgi:hypothetical protein
LATEETKGFYFSLFWAIYTSSQFFGNIIAALVLGNLKETYYFCIMGVVAFSSVFIFATLRNPKPSDSGSNQYTNSSSTLSEMVGV